MSRFLLGGVFLLALGPATEAREHIPLTVPYQKFSQTLIAAANLDDKPYIVVPVTLQVGADELLIGMKRGYRHSGDTESVFEINSYQPSTGRLQGVRARIGELRRGYYNGEFVRHINGDISCYIDVQEGGSTVRLGLREVRSTDGGRTFSDPVRVGLMAGVEYGYVFSSVNRDGRTYMVAMTFANLAGGQTRHPRWAHAGSVDVLTTGDNGRTWRRLRQLSPEVGEIPINETTMLPCGDGWLVATGTYDKQQWLLRTDADFKPLAKRNLTADFDCVNSQVGRPRMYQIDGRYYLLGRNWTNPLGGERSPMQLCLFRFSPETLGLENCVVLDNSERNNVVDGYYASIHWRKQADVTLLNIITYKRSDFLRGGQQAAFHAPDLIRLEYAWDEIK